MGRFTVSVLFLVTVLVVAAAYMEEEPAMRPRMHDRRRAANTDYTYYEYIDLKGDRNDDYDNGDSSSMDDNDNKNNDNNNDNDYEEKYEDNSDEDDDEDSDDYDDGGYDNRMSGYMSSAAQRTQMVVCTYGVQFMRDPNNCHQFYQCAHGIPFLHKCGDGLVFNTKHNVCDWPYNVDCQSSPQYSSQAVYSTPMSYQPPMTQSYQTPMTQSYQPPMTQSYQPQMTQSYQPTSKGSANPPVYYNMPPMTSSKGGQEPQMSMDYEPQQTAYYPSNKGDQQAYYTQQSYFQTSKGQKSQPLYLQKAQPVYYQKAQPVYYQKAQPVYTQKAQPVYYQKAQPVYTQKAQPVYVQKAQPVYYQKAQPTYIKAQPRYVQMAQPRMTQMTNRMNTRMSQPRYVKVLQPVKSHAQMVPAMQPVMTRTQSMMPSQTAYFYPVTQNKGHYQTRSRTMYSTMPRSMDMTAPVLVGKSDTKSANNDFDFMYYDYDSSSNTNNKKGDTSDYYDYDYNDFQPSGPMMQAMTAPSMDYNTYEKTNSFGGGALANPQYFGKAFKGFSNNKNLKASLKQLEAMKGKTQYVHHDHTGGLAALTGGFGITGSGGGGGGMSKGGLLGGDLLPLLILASATNTNGGTAAAGNNNLNALLPLILLSALDGSNGKGFNLGFGKGSKGKGKGDKGDDLLETILLLSLLTNNQNAGGPNVALDTANQQYTSLATGAPVQLIDPTTGAVVPTAQTAINTQTGQVVNTANNQPLVIQDPTTGRVVNAISTIPPAPAPAPAPAANTANRAILGLNSAAATVQPSPGGPSYIRTDRLLGAGQGPNAGKDAINLIFLSPLTPSSLPPPIINNDGSATYIRGSLRDILGPDLARAVNSGQVLPQPVGQGARACKVVRSSETIPFRLNPRSGRRLSASECDAMGQLLNKFIPTFLENFLPRDAAQSGLNSNKDTNSNSGSSTDSTGSNVFQNDNDPNNPSTDGSSSLNQIFGGNGNNLNEFINVRNDGDECTIAVPNIVPRCG